MTSSKGKKWGRGLSENYDVDVQKAARRLFIDANVGVQRAVRRKWRGRVLNNYENPCLKTPRTGRQFPSCSRPIAGRPSLPCFSYCITVKWLQFTVQPAADCNKIVTIQPVRLKMDAPIYQEETTWTYMTLKTATSGARENPRTSWPSFPSTTPFPGVQTNFTSRRFIKTTPPS